jgi:hypothetical protein
MLMFRQENAGHRIIQTDNASFEKVTNLKHAGTTPTIRIACIKKPIKFGECWLPFFQNLLSSSLLFKNVKNEKLEV